VQVAVNVGFVVSLPDLSEASVTRGVLDVQVNSGNLLSQLVKQGLVDLTEATVVTRASPITVLLPPPIPPTPPPPRRPLPPPPTQRLTSPILRPPPSSGPITNTTVVVYNSTSDVTQDTRNSSPEIPSDLADAGASWTMHYTALVLVSMVVAAFCFAFWRRMRRQRARRGQIQTAYSDGAPDDDVSLSPTLIPLAMSSRLPATPPLTSPSTPLRELHSSSRTQPGQANLKPRSPLHSHRDGGSCTTTVGSAAEHVSQFQSSLQALRGLGVSGELHSASRTQPGQNNLTTRPPRDSHRDGGGGTTTVGSAAEHVSKFQSSLQALKDFDVSAVLTHSIRTRQTIESPSESLVSYNDCVNPLFEPLHNGRENPLFENLLD
jgi:hypothetical protein